MVLMLKPFQSSTTGHVHSTITWQADCIILSTDELSAVQLALEPLWKLYEVCSPGADADVKATMSKAVKSLSLTQV